MWSLMLKLLRNFVTRIHQLARNYLMLRFTLVSLDASNHLLLFAIVFRSNRKPPMLKDMAIGDVMEVSELFC